MRKFQEVIKHIEENLYQEVSLESVSNEFHYSTAYFSRMFSMQTGMTLKNYILKRRLSEAAIKLRETNSTIEYIAHVSGFKTQKYFSYRFKCEYKVTPSEYRSGKKFIDITRKREISERTLKKMKLNEFKERLFQEVTNRNNLMDLLNEVENAILFSEEGKIKIIFVEEMMQKTTISELRVSLTKGKFSQRTIFIMPSSDYVVRNLYIEDGVKIVIQRLRDQEEITARLYQGEKGDVDVMTEAITDLRIFDESDMEPYFRTFELEATKFVEELQNCRNQLEIQNTVNAENNSVILKEFGSEFLILKLCNIEGVFTVITIFVDFSTDYISTYQNYFNNTKALKVELRDGNGVGLIYCDEELHAKCSVHMGDDITSDIHIKFPSGMAGAGDWDINREFETN